MGEAKRRQQNDPAWGQRTFVRYIDKPRIPEDQYLAAIGCLPDLVYERRYGLKIGAMVDTPRTRLEDLFRLRQWQVATALSWELLGRSNNLVQMEFPGNEGIQPLVKLNIAWWQLAKAVLERWQVFDEFWPLFERLPSPWDWMLGCCTDLVETSMRNQGLLDSPRLTGKGKVYDLARQAKEVQALPLDSIDFELLEVGNGVTQNPDCVSMHISNLEYMGQHIATLDTNCGRKFKPWFKYLQERTSAYRAWERSDIKAVYRLPDGLKDIRGRDVNC